MHQKTILDNGLRVLTGTMPHTRSVSICIFVGVGARYEDDAHAGISHYLEHMLFKGSRKRPTSRDISEAVEGVGGTINAGTDKEMTIYWCKVAGEHFARALDVLTDMMLNPIIDPAEFERERQVIIDEINMTLDVPSQRVDMLIDELLWYGHPLGREVAGYKESVAALSRDALLGYLRSQYLPTDTVVAIAGDIEHSEAVAAVEKALGSWNNSRTRAGFVPYREQPGPHLRIESRDTEQTHLSLGVPGYSLHHPKRFALDLLNIVLGEGMSSRLFAEIRDHLGLAYSISSYVDHFLDTGALTVYAGVEPGKLLDAIRAIVAELGRLREPVPESELTKAKELSKGRLVLRLEDSRSVAGWLGGQEILLGEILELETVLRIIDSITAAQLQETANELISDSRLRLAVVGPGGNNRAALEEALRIK